MIRNVHVDMLREQVEQARADLAGWEHLLAQAEQGARAGQFLPDPLMPTGTPWPVPGPVERRQPYPASTSVMPAVDGSQLPPGQDAAFEAFQADHAEHAASPEGQRDEQKWRSA